jgi:hypothetical protein
MKKISMKNALWRQSTVTETPALTRFRPGRFVLALILLLVISAMISSCSKQALGSDPLETSMQMDDMHMGHNLWMTNELLQPQTIQELKDARNATAKYQNINNAIADGYADISVIRENMGFHYLKATLVDTVFDPTKPELLVYNRKENGKAELVALEYAVPIALRPFSAPNGFTGSNDVWKYDTEFGLWLLHAWVWEYNPAGIFNPTNPLVHLH